MNLLYSLDENDYLQYYLFDASKSKRIIGKRKRSWLTITILLLILSVAFYFTTDRFLSFMYLVLSVLALAFYPVLQRKSYAKHYRKFVAESFKADFNKVSNVIFLENSLEINNRTGESKIYLSSLRQITETGNYIYMMLKGGGAIIIPKLKISKLAEAKQYLHELSRRFNIEYVEELNWEWK